MSLRMELEDLPQRYQEQARKQIEARKKGGTKKKSTPAPAGLNFDSQGEQDYYLEKIMPLIRSGEIARVTLHKTFLLLPEKIYGSIKLPKAEYTPDFLIEYSDGTVEAVEVKSKFVRRQQKDYIYRRRLFIDLVAEPRNWRFTEIITADTKEEIKLWSKLKEKNDEKNESRNFGRI